MIRNLLQRCTWRRKRGLWLKISFMEIFFPAASIFSPSFHSDLFLPFTTDTGKLFSKSTNVLSRCRQKVRKRMFLPLPAYFCSCELQNYFLAGMQGAEEKQEGEPPPGIPTVPTQHRVGGLQLWAGCLDSFCFLLFWLGWLTVTSCMALPAFWEALCSPR